jgi:hypothetical protein
MKRNTLLVFALLGAIFSLSACAKPITYSAEPMEAWVVDRETKQPIEGAVVVAHWQLEGGLHTDRVGELMILETTSDKNGRFSFPAWGPITHRGRGRLTNMDPELIIFKSGYEYRRLANPLTKEAIDGWPIPVRRSQWNGKTIELKPFEGTASAYENHFESFNGELDRVAADSPKECGWKKIPTTIRAMNRERHRLISQGVNPNTLSSIDKRLLMNDEYFTHKGGCGSPKEFFKDLHQ